MPGISGAMRLQMQCRGTVLDRAANYPSVFTITEKALTVAFIWLKAPASLSLLRHYALCLTGVKTWLPMQFHKGQADFIC